MPSPDAITAAFREHGGNLAAAARLLGMTRPQLQYRLKKRAATG